MIYSNQINTVETLWRQIVFHTVHSFINIYTKLKALSFSWHGPHSIYSDCTECSRWISSMYFKSLAKHFHGSQGMVTKEYALEDLSSSRSSSSSCSSWALNQLSQPQQQSWQGSQSSHGPCLTLSGPPEVQCALQGAQWSWNLVAALHQEQTTCLANGPNHSLLACRETWCSHHMWCMATLSCK